MGKKCLKCGYERQEGDIAPAYECPKCGAVYAKVEAAIQKVKEQESEKRREREAKEQEEAEERWRRAEEGMIRVAEEQQAQEAFQRRLAEEERIQRELERETQEAENKRRQRKEEMRRIALDLADSARPFTTVVIVLLYVLAVLSLIGGISLSVEFWPEPEIVVSKNRSIPTPAVSYTFSYAWLALGITQFALFSAAGLVVSYLRDIRDSMWQR